jgi:hypothetical protein
MAARGLFLFAFRNAQNDVAVCLAWAAQGLEFRHDIRHRVEAFEEIFGFRTERYVRKGPRAALQSPTQAGTKCQI